MRTLADKLVDAGRDIAAVRLEDLPKKPDMVAAAAKSASSNRMDFRINDQIPLIWSIVTQESFDVALDHFKKKRAFGLRPKIAMFQGLLRELEEGIELLQRKNSKARRNVVWFRDHLSWLFLRATSEPEEDFFVDVTRLFLGVVGLLVKNPVPPGQTIQLLTYLKNRLEIQQIHDQSNPVTEERKLAKARRDLDELDRQLPRILVELHGKDAEMSAQLGLLKEALETVRFTQLDMPFGKTPDGKDTYPANISATGLAFRTRKTGVNKGDMLEMRIFLSADGNKFVPVNCYGRVVFVQTVREGVIKVATHIDPQPPELTQLLFAHIARKQREELIQRRENADNRDNRR